jgi:hypothetical protein
MASGGSLDGTCGCESHQLLICQLEAEAEGHAFTNLYVSRYGEQQPAILRACWACSLAAILSCYIYKCNRACLVLVFTHLKVGCSLTLLSTEVSA